MKTKARKCAKTRNPVPFVFMKDSIIVVIIGHWILTEGGRVQDEQLSKFLFAIFKLSRLGYFVLARVGGKFAPCVLGRMAIYQREESAKF